MQKLRVQQRYCISSHILHFLPNQIDEHHFSNALLILYPTHIGYIILQTHMKMSLTFTLPIQTLHLIHHLIHFLAANLVTT